MSPETSDVMITTPEMLQFAITVLVILVVGQVLRWLWARRRWLLMTAALLCSRVAVVLARAACRATAPRPSRPGRVAS